MELYDAQEEAILELLSGEHVILATPTGSGKSLVAMAGHYASLARGERSYYTAPIKALVSEKFFALSREFGSDNVGMITGDVSVNPDAPIVCCTQEIVANLALRRGRSAEMGLVVVDEFHYYADPQRGWAWQVPLLELPHTQFLLMSATLGPTARFEEDLEARTGRTVAVVDGAERPVPLDFQWVTSAVHATVEELIEREQTPAYVVYFTQKASLEAAQSFTSLSICSKDEKAAIREAVGNFRFDTPIGKDLKRFLSHGVGLHHAGLLPKYRLLMEKLAQQGLLKVIVGTDTLGVGVNVPIRSVLLTQLFKYDGRQVRILTVREFLQIAGRAGRKGFDDEGFVRVQAPPHVIENLQAERKAAADPSRKKKTQKKKPPERGYAHWTEDTFDKLVNGRPEPMVSSFDVSHQMLLNLLDRPPIAAAADTPSQPGGCAAVRHLLTDNHESRPAQRRHIRRAISMYRSLLDAEVIEVLDEPDDEGREVRVTVDLQDDFALNQPLSLFAVEIIERLDPLAYDGAGGALEHALDVLSIVESTLENPGAILAAQLDKAKTDLLADMKRDGVEYEERMERLETVEYPKPLRDELYGAFDGFRTRHPWVGSENIKPKSVARELHERAMTFSEYVKEYGMKRSEGLVLRYLTDCWRAMVQTVPESEKTDEVIDLIEWLGETVRQVDSSLIDEWERLTNPDDAPDDGATGLVSVGSDQRDVTTNERAFMVMIRNETFRWVQLLARRNVDELSRRSDPDHALDIERARTPLRPADQVERMVDAYFDEHDDVLTGPDARGGGFFQPGQIDVDDVRGEHRPVRQVVRDPAGHDEWGLIGWVDIERSREAGMAVVVFDEIRRL